MSSWPLAGLLPNLPICGHQDAGVSRSEIDQVTEEATAHAVASSFSVGLLASEHLEL